jgi:hypothetical protein
MIEGAGAQLGLRSRLSSRCVEPTLRLLPVFLLACCTRTADAPRAPAPTTALLLGSPRYVSRACAADSAGNPPGPVHRSTRSWRDAPVEYAIRWGAPADRRSALVLAEGELAFVDLVTGAIRVVTQGLARGYQCSGIRVPTDVVFACDYSYGRNPATDHAWDASGRDVQGLVVSHTLDGAPVVEQAFSAPGFWASDDGSLAGLGCFRPDAKPIRGVELVRSPMPGATPPEPVRFAICVRGVDGGWHTRELDGGMDDRPRFQVARWVPRADGNSVAVVRNIDGQEDVWGSVDTASGELHRWPADPDSPAVHETLTTNARVEGTLDRGWTWTASGVLLGWGHGAGGLTAIQIREGIVTRSAYAFEQLRYAGPVALGRARTGQLWQTLDHGATWTAVAGPPGEGLHPPWLDPPLTPIEASGPCEGPAACSLVGCAVGAFYRIGWAAPFPSVALSIPRGR